MRPDGGDPDAQCPVDHKTREKWLEAARAKGQPSPAHPSPPPSPTSQSRTRYSLDTGSWQTITSPAAPSRPPTTQRRPSPPPLSTTREVSTIPRATSTTTIPLNSAEQAALPANAEHDTGHDATTGNWIYPSQEMFFAAMRRKGHAPPSDPASMASIVPIHNAVNERAWSHILAYERGRGSEACGGPKLVSFAGDSKALTPKARWKMLQGYEAPFDRHDWVVERCGRRVEYVIDFYAGGRKKLDGPGGGVEGLGPSFYLDVRPKVNSWEGVKTRVLYAVGL